MKPGALRFLHVGLGGRLNQLNFFPGTANYAPFPVSFPSFELRPYGLVFKPHKQIYSVGEVYEVVASPGSVEERREHTLGLLERSVSFNAVYVYLGENYRTDIGSYETDDLRNPTLVVETDRYRAALDVVTSKNNRLRLKVVDVIPKVEGVKKAELYRELYDALDDYYYTNSRIVEPYKDSWEGKYATYSAVLSYIKALAYVLSRRLRR